MRPRLSFIKLLYRSQFIATNGMTPVATALARAGGPRQGSRSMSISMIRRLIPRRRNTHSSLSPDGVEIVRRDVDLERLGSFGNLTACHTPFHTAISVANPSETCQPPRRALEMPKTVQVTEFVLVLATAWSALSSSPESRDDQGGSDGERCRSRAHSGGLERHARGSPHQVELERYGFRRAVFVGLGAHPDHAAAQAPLQ